MSQPQPRIEVAAIDSFVLRLFERIDEANMPWLLAAEENLRAAFGAALLDLVPSYTTLLLQYDLLQLDPGEARARIAAALSDLRPKRQDGGRLHILPTWYDPRVGPAPLARRKQLGVAELIRRHSQREYRVFALGFSPGFAFMGLVEEALAAPRLATPRQRIAAGSVGIAERQTAVYPQASPGGWNLLGRCPVRLFDLTLDGYSLLRAGDRVRFEPIGHAEFVRLGGDDTPWRSRHERLHPRRPAGVPEHPAGPVAGSRPLRLPPSRRDPGRRPRLAVHGLGQLAAGQSLDAAVIEIALGGFVAECRADGWLALAGGDLGATLDGQPLPAWGAFAVRGGQRLAFAHPRQGARAYLAAPGGFAGERQLGSLATVAREGLGGPAPTARPWPQATASAGWPMARDRARCPAQRTDHGLHRRSAPGADPRRADRRLPGHEPVRCVQRRLAGGYTRRPHGRTSARPAPGMPAAVDDFRRHRPRRGAGAAGRSADRPAQRPADHRRLPRLGALAPLALARLAQCLPGQRVRLLPTVQEAAHREHRRLLAAWDA